MCGSAYEKKSKANIFCLKNNKLHFIGFMKKHIKNKLRETEAQQ